MGLKRGVLLGPTGGGGALVERQLNLVGGAVDARLALSLPPEVYWGLGCVAAVVGGDVFTRLTGQDVSLGKHAGLWKGLAAAAAGVGSLYAGGSLLYPIVSMWAVTVVGDLLGY